ncbi:hypothetical protein [Salinactinospora qingdaonensis]|uniref:Uncharacterized protein n=1 Tax=Salinactinospora qingdaonensis TaxID=702744 RepID=A0ABP7FJ73_9ACTN
MPRKRRRVSAFFKILAVLTVVCGGLVAGGYYVITSTGPVELTPPEPASGCLVMAGGDTDQLEVAQAANAATIGGVAFAEDLPSHAVVIAYATVWQESKFRNLEFGDRDSLGLFQQRPSQEWGEPEELLDPVYASSQFYGELVTVQDYRDMPVYEAAQAVQHSADGFAYDQHESRARTMVTAFTGQEPAAVSCWYERDETTRADTATAREEMTRVFGAEPDALPVSDTRRTGDLGWAMALWAVSHAEEYGLSSVTYGDQRWTPTPGENGWRTLPHGEGVAEGHLRMG